MGATPAQIEAVVALGASSHDGTSKTEADAFNTAYGEVYQNEPNDPSVLAAALKMANAKTVVVTSGGDISSDGGTSQATILITYGDNTTSTDATDATWTSAGVTDATISDGLVTGNSTNGTETITATTDGISGSAEVILTNQL